jgi:hypothetical protein
MAANAQALADFDNILTKIGFSQQQCDVIIEASGCHNLAMIGLLIATQITKMCKWIESHAINPLVIMTVQEQLLLGLQYWVANKQQLHQPIIAEEFTMITALNQAQIMHLQAEDDARMDKEIVTKASDKFKSGSTWKVFAEVLETYLSQLLGLGHVPLSYVIQRLEVPDQNTVYQTEQEQNIVIAPLTGPAFLSDNDKVNGVNKQLVLEGPGHSYILPFDHTSDSH